MFDPRETLASAKQECVVLIRDIQIRQDPSGTHVRLDVNSILKDKSGAVISYRYTGTIKVTPEIGSVLSGDPSAKTTTFGNACRC